MRKLNYQLIESATPPLIVNPNTLWVDKDESTGEFKSIKQRRGNEWVELLASTDNTGKIDYTLQGRLRLLNQALFKGKALVNYLGGYDDSSEEVYLSSEDEEIFKNDIRKDLKLADNIEISLSSYITQISFIDNSKYNEIKESGFEDEELVKYIVEGENLLPAPEALNIVDLGAGAIGYKLPFAEGDDIRYFELLELKYIYQYLTCLIVSYENTTTGKRILINYSYPQWIIDKYFIKKESLVDSLIERLFPDKIS